MKDLLEDLLNEDGDFEHFSALPCLGHFEDTDSEEEEWCFLPHYTLSIRQLEVASDGFPSKILVLLLVLGKAEKLSLVLHYQPHRVG